MNTKNRLTVVLAVCLFALVGCGGGGGGSEVPNSTPTPTLQTGYLIDSTVQGLKVRSGASESITDAEGSFTYEEGAPTTFFLGGISLGTAQTGPVVTVGDIAGSDSYRTNLMRFLQSLDEDGNADNGITISPAVQTAAASMTLDFSQDVDAFEADSRTQYAMSVLGSLLMPSRSAMLAVGDVRAAAPVQAAIQWTAATNTRGWNGKVQVVVPGAAPVELISLRYVLVGGRSEQCLVIVNKTNDVNVLVGRTVFVGSKAYRIERPGVLGNGQVRYQGPAGSACTLPTLAVGGPYAVSIR